MVVSVTPRACRARRSVERDPLRSRQTEQPGSHPDAEGARRRLARPESKVALTGCASWWRWPYRADRPSSRRCSGPGTEATRCCRSIPACRSRRSGELLAALAPTRLVDASGDERSLAGGRPVEDGDAVVVATSGSTGAPKGVVHTHDSVAASSTASSARLEVDPARDRWLACLPLAHIGGLSVVLRSLHTGTPLEVHDGFDAAAVEDAARRGRHARVGGADRPRPHRRQPVPRARASAGPPRPTTCRPTRSPATA